MCEVAGNDAEREEGKGAFQQESASPRMSAMYIYLMGSNQKCSDFLGS